MIKKCCENCANCIILHNEEYCNYYDIFIKPLKEDEEMCDSNFVSKEELVREDERNKILNLLKEDLEDYKTLREEYKDNKNLTIENTGIFMYINVLINEIERCNYDRIN